MDITRFGVFIPINLPVSSKAKYKDTPPIPEPEPDNLALVRRGEDWGVFWTLADEEDMAPEAGASINWLMSAHNAVGRKHILAHGFQFGEPVLYVVTGEAGDPIPDLGQITRHDWTTQLTPP